MNHGGVLQVSLRPGTNGTRKRTEHGISTGETAQPRSHSGSEAQGMFSKEFCQLGLGFKEAMLMIVDVL